MTVYVSLPMRGVSGGDGQDAADGARLALSEAGGESGEREVRAVFLDDHEGNIEGARRAGLHTILVGTERALALAELDELLAE